ncbi:MAG: uroporphyrinogen-III synthase [Candidatus Rokubacteria bacterium]|nr:uroporphyrinogen-III synthase [Candidatus Rokubacteria bacterium]
MRAQGRVAAKPLAGKRIVVTRARQQAARFTRLLEEAGAEVLEVPTISIEPPDSWEPLDMAIEELESFRWLIFTSVNGVEMFRIRLEGSRRDVGALVGLRIAVIGPATATALQQWGRRADVVPDVYRAEALVERLRSEIRPGDRVLIPRAVGARDVLVAGLTELGAIPTEVPTYRARPVRDPVGRLAQALRRRDIDAVTFTSSSTVRNFAELFSPRERAELLKGVVVASIGPVTARTSAECGLPTHVMPREYTIPALARALIDYFTEERS